MTRLPNGLGRTIVIALIAGVVFAAFLMVTPRLTASSRDALDPDPTTMPITTTTTTVPVTTTTQAPPPPTTVAASQSIRMTIERIVEDHGKNEIFDGDQVDWRFRIDNLSDETLWGVYAYLELHGRAPCEDHVLDPGESTDCWIRTKEYQGFFVAEAWVTAWTNDEMVWDKVFVDLIVLP